MLTGASSGIGRACAVRFARRGDRLLLMARGAGPLEETRRECLAAGAPEVVVHPADVADHTAVEAAVDRAVAEFGGLAIVVHAAAVAAYGRLQDVPVEVFDAVIDTDVKGSAHVARAALRHFRTQERGTLIFLGSVLGRMTTPFMSSYGVSKWAVRSLARALLQENLDLPDVHVCEVWPGGVNTPVYQQSGNYAGRVGRPPPPVVSADRVAAAVERTADHPKPRTMVGLFNPIMMIGFGAFPWVFDRLVVPLMSRIGIGREPAAPGPGNVLAPRPRLNATDGPWRGPLGLRRRKSDGGKP